jgi:hypothetical protein
MKRLLTAALLALALASAPAHVWAESPAAPDPSTETAQAQSDAALAALPETLRMGETFDIMVQEGLAYGDSIEEQMFPGRGGARWKAMVATIYDAPALRQNFDAALMLALRDDPATVAAALDFFGSDLGQRILGHEIEARRILLDEAAEEAARVEAERMQAERDPRMGLIRDLAEAGDLIEANVAGALSANLAFFQGMNSVGVPGMVMDDEQMMLEVWGQEDSIRDETAKWLYPYLALAYRPMSDDDLKAYIAFAETPEGKRLNAALFLAFDEVFRVVSHDLGRGAALVLQGNDI